MTEKDDKGSDILEGCEPCAIYDAFNKFCKELGRVKVRMKIPEAGNGVEVKPGDNACGLLSNMVYDGKLDPDVFYNTLVKLYGEDTVTRYALQYLADDKATQRRSDAGAGHDDRAAQPPSASEEKVEKSGQGRAESQDAQTSVPPKETPPAQANDADSKDGDANE